MLQCHILLCLAAWMLAASCEVTKRMSDSKKEDHNNKYNKVFQFVFVFSYWRLAACFDFVICSNFVCDQHYKRICQTQKRGLGLRLIICSCILIGMKVFLNSATYQWLCNYFVKQACHRWQISGNALGGIYTKINRLVKHFCLAKQCTVHVRCNTKQI
jgi:hypothetical protein